MPGNKLRTVGPKIPLATAPTTQFAIGFLLMKECHYSGLNERVNAEINIYGVIPFEKKLV